MLSKYTCKNYAEEGPFLGWYVLLKDETPVLATPVYHGPNGYSDVRDAMKQIELKNLARCLKNTDRTYDPCSLDDDF